MTLKNKEYVVRITWAAVSFLITCTFFLFNLYTEHKEMAQSFPGIQLEQRRLAMNDTLMTIEMRKIVQDNQINKKVLYGIANKLHVEIPVQ